MSKTVLIVDDDRLNMKLSKDLLEANGYLTLQASNGRDGLDLARMHHPDLILMDIQLPGIDGYEVTRRIRTNPELTKTPIIAVTSYALSGDDQKAFAAGCDGYVTKPFSPRMLLAKIREYLP